MKLYDNVFMRYEDMLISNGKELFGHQLEGLDSASCKIDGIQSTILIQVSSNEYNDQYEQRNVVCDLETELKRGSIITDVQRKGFNTIEEGSWLVITDIDINQVSRYAKVQKCNNSISFQLSDSTTIHTYPCIFSRSISANSDGTDNLKYFLTNDEIVNITIQNNSITKEIPLNKRFVFDNFINSIYEIKSMDVSEKKGLIQFKLLKSEKQADDRLDLNVANYVEQVIPDEDDYSIIVSGASSITASGYQKEYVATVTLDGLVVDKEVSFKILETTTLASIISASGMNCIVKANSDMDIGIVTLRCLMVDDETVYFDKEITIKGLF